MDRNSRQKNSASSFSEPEHELLRSAAKSLWKNRYRYQFNFYCPLCRIPRRIGRRPKPVLSHFLQVGLTAAFFTLLTWEWFAFKGLVSFLPLWIIFETIYRSQMRAALKCKTCGFDPNLYLVDVRKAKADVEKYWEMKLVEKGIYHPKINPEGPHRRPRSYPGVSESLEDLVEETEEQEGSQEESLDP
jgi:hypothetical protein